MSVIEDIYALKKGEASCLYQGNDVEVWQYRHYRWLNQGGQLIQSIMDVDNPARPINPVTQYMLAALSMLSQSNRLLNLGFGAGTIERYLHAFFPGRSLHSVDNNELVIHLAREFFAIDPGYTVYLEEAGRFVAKADDTYDAILCDIFDGQCHPDCLYENDFYSACRQRLSADGLLIANLVPEDENDMLELLLPLRKNFSHSGLIELPEHDNVILLASNASLERPLNKTWADTLHKEAETTSATDAKAILDTMTILPQRIDPDRFSTSSPP